VSKSVKSKPSGPPPRRQPTQERSQRRYDAIVEAAAQSFATFGFDATTMEGIAARADTSIGSLYQFFPNKHALFHAVARECLRRSRAHFERMLGPDAVSADWRVLLTRVIDGYYALQDDTYMQSIWRNLHLYGEYAEDDEAMMREFIGVTAGIIGVWAPKLAVDHRRIIATTVVNAISMAMLQVGRAPRADGQAIITETKHMLERYLSAYVDRDR
jgi:AcrR family transcriptional regulator